MATFHRYAVGEPYISGTTQLPTGVQYSFRGGEHELLLWLDRLREEDIADIRRGDCEFAVFTEGTLLLFLYRFGRAIPWSDAPFSIWRVRDEERRFPERVSGAQQALLHVILVEAETGLVRALRSVSLGRAVTAALHAAILAQAESRDTPADEDRRLASVYERYPTTSDMVGAAVARSPGGEP